MLVDAGWLDQWTNRGHTYGTCMSSPSTDLMYVNIPKNASSWTKPNLQDWGWEFYNYYDDQGFENKIPIIVLRDPIERWLSGIAEYFALYHPDFKIFNEETIELIFARVCFDDHTEQQIKFVHGLDIGKSIFLKCDTDYRKNFSDLLNSYNMPNRYFNYAYQHVSSNNDLRKKFKEIFTNEIQKSKYLKSIKDYYSIDYQLMDSVKFYESR